MDISVKIMILLIVMLILLFAKIVYDEKKYIEKLTLRLKKTWGMPTRNEYTEAVWKNIKYYHNRTASENDIDDITWNDLDMNSVYEKLNHTRTSVGEEYLYSLLHRPCIDKDELYERERVIRLMAENEDERLKLQIAFSQMGKPGKISVYEYMSGINEISAPNKLKHIFCGIAFFVSGALCFVWPSVMVLVFIAVVVYNVYSYYKDKAMIEPYIQLFGFIVRTVDQSKEIVKIRVPGLDKYMDKLDECIKSFKKFCKKSSLIAGGGQMSGDLLDSLMDYVRMLVHVDIIKICTMVSEAKKCSDELFKIYDIIGFLDSMISICSYRSSLDKWCIPEFDKEKTGLSAGNIYHPLIDEPVKNSINSDKSVLLTGSNASGKSTFLKTIAINAIFAQTIYTVLADSYKTCFYYIYSSMALRDDLQNNESYYIVEIKSLKRILNKTSESKVPVLCFIDEVLRGTNTLERIASSSEILAYLTGNGAMCFAATHDVELTNMLKEYYSNYHFEEQVDENKVLFDYKLRRGPANSRNAIKLLNMIGYDKVITCRAEKQAERFLDTGVWGETII